MISKNSTQDSYIGSTSASQAEEAGSITSILPPQDGRDAQHRSFWRSQKKMRRDTEAAQLPEYSRICRAEHGNENFICRIRTSVVHRLPKPRRRVRLPYPAPKRNAIQMDGISFWNMGPAANSWFDRKHFAVDRRPRCNASQLLAQPKENAQGHGGGFAAGVLPYARFIC